MKNAKRIIAVVFSLALALTGVVSLSKISAAKTYSWKVSNKAKEYDSVVNVGQDGVYASYIERKIKPAGSSKYITLDGRPEAPSNSKYITVYLKPFSSSCTGMPVFYGDDTSAYDSYDNFINNFKYSKTAKSGLNKMFYNVEPTEKFLKKNIKLFYKKSNGKWYSKSPCCVDICINSICVDFKNTNAKNQKSYKIGLKMPSGNYYMVTYSSNGKRKVKTWNWSYFDTSKASDYDLIELD